MDKFEEKTLFRKPVFSGKIIQVFVDQVALPSGETAERELVFHPGGVAVLPITADNKMIFVKQFRKPLEKVTLEIPAGKIEGRDDAPLKTAQRELEEETSYQAKKWEKITSFYLSPGFANEILHIYEAKDLIFVEEPLPQDTDETIELFTLTLAQAKKEIESGLICDAKTIFALYYWELQQILEK